MYIDHIGIVVKAIEKAISQWENTFGYSRYTNVIENTRQKVKVTFMKKDNSMLVKLIEPVDESSPVYQFAQRGGGFHHLCFRTTNMAAKIDELKKNGARLIVPPQPGEAFDNEEIAFLLTNQNIYFELMETDKKSEVL